MSNQSNISSYPAPVGVAFGSFNPIVTDKLQFDVISSFQYSGQQPSLNTPILGSGMGNVRKQFYGVVVISPNREAVDNGFGVRSLYDICSTSSQLVGYDYEVYESSNTSVFSPEQSILKGSICETNNNTFTFPISDINQDYFVLISPWFKKTQRSDKLEPWATLQVQKGVTTVSELESRQTSDTMYSTSTTSVNIQPNLQIRPDPSISGSTTSVTIVKGERLFRIFYTKRILKDRKDKIESYKKLQRFNEKLRRTPPNFGMEYEDIVKQRDEDIEVVKRYQSQFSKKQTFDKLFQFENDFEGKYKPREMFRFENDFEDREQDLKVNLNKTNTEHKNPIENDSECYNEELYDYNDSIPVKQDLKMHRNKTKNNHVDNGSFCYNDELYDNNDYTVFVKHEPFVKMDKNDNELRRENSVPTQRRFSCNIESQNDNEFSKQDSLDAIEYFNNVIKQLEDDYEKLVEDRDNIGRECDCDHDEWSTVTDEMTMSEDEMINDLEDTLPSKK